MRTKKQAWTIGMAAAGVVLTGIAAPVFADQSLTETGSSLMYPLFQQEWIPAYEKVNSNVSMSAAATGSGTGISDAIAGTVNIGASDAYLAPSQVASTPGIENIPMAVSAQTVMYNLPGVKPSAHLKLSGNVLALIYEGKIKKWNDPRLVSLNPGVKLPNQPIVTVRRSDGSGDTFLFTTLLSDTNNWWKSNVGYGTSVSWPAVQGQIGAKGNSGIVAALAKTPYSLSYVGISYLKQALAASPAMGEAAIQNRAGRFVLPTNATIQAAAEVGAKHVPKDEAVSLIYEPGTDSYPLINFEYVIVNRKQQDSNTADLVKGFLQWAISPDGGQQLKYMTPVNFLPLPASISALSKAQIDAITG
ncbi:phosphate ABC transporter substrate-binding protein (PhoT family) [Alicyclobacillus sacchari]|uniref:Phosphate-binding protein n=1 Tax=Alicyclobacillus sacchari TaxID=392010 RepID=A0A4R8LKB9_9BACL|nr:phosphate ABC transporter substrate-binding protein PstS [Alicyclobacillus sacchari]TDY44605.1 phosphate ABC transporter substrate-binding protein (PhoT family) [Alicyclobacillus sacchari]GMA57961.1 phosphate-binding protein PstS 1 [Alicyclobacillus sacchari]